MPCVGITLLRFNLRAKGRASLTAITPDVSDHLVLTVRNIGATYAFTRIHRDVRDIDIKEVAFGQRRRALRFDALMINARLVGADYLCDPDSPTEASNSPQPGAPYSRVNPLAPLPESSQWYG